MVEYGGNVTEYFGYRTRLSLVMSGFIYAYYMKCFSFVNMHQHQN